ncbi:cytochrome c biogenesis heme-transporting ATPase CcmA [Psychrosphaera aquimarina]|uniref:Cytochrome c biogenesis heme-transporting ATPase CcmA n=1 Tax=Psychrosphaera aquimarina TaxID=2044854 RepID=A0ABU3R4L7_9GAMM|nr:cytochrome c biogenesis heme-transporting ATPase CcmA [Psychrosphaera aquimarina]MDU0114615.1 cytochrome c biogenesis heme-transporting ATPase CcmA [Psychrosphaera aquimarina]
MLEVQGLTCFRQNRCLFADLNFVLSEHQICQIEGPNGAGKSTLLRAILGLFRADEGQVIWSGKSTTQQAELFLQQVFFLGHKFAINSDLTPWQNLEFWSALNPTQNDDFDSALTKVGLTGLEHIPCHSLSAGQHRRVALARLWLTNTKLWVLDEPFTAIDKSGVQLLQQRFNSHLTSGGMILLTSHQDLSQDFAQLHTIKLTDNTGEII